MIRNDSIKNLGLELKKEIIELIKNENIDIEYSYEASFRQNGYFYFELNKENHIIPLKIVVPKLIDSDLKLAIILAHELGHYYVYKNNPYFKNKLIVGSRNQYVIYYNEKQAWIETKCIIDNLGYWRDDVSIIFDEECNQALRSYQPKKHLLNSITKPILNLIEYWIGSYFIVSLFYLLSQNGIPIPFITNNITEDINRVEFFNTVNGWFCLFIIYRIMIFSLSSLKSK